MQQIKGESSNGGALG